jgi:photosystem II stability/assembly factor-like uncharacterized protein
MKKIITCTIIFLECFLSLHAQTITLLTSGTKTSLRGLSVVSKNIIWASGSNGTVAKSIDAGQTWKWITVKGFEKTDFRDIEAFNDSTALIMGIDSPAYILKTTNGGETWKTGYQNNTKGMFLDAMDFINEKNGIVIGDPINGKFFIARTNDRGNSWQEDSFDKRPLAELGEACFASSGTNIKMINSKKYMLVSGGLTANLIDNSMTIKLPILQGKESTGANSIAIKNNKMMIVVGGDFSSKDTTTKNCFISINGGKTWISPIKSPSGYRSCIEYFYGNLWLTCGLNGIDISYDNGMNFNNISNESFHVCKAEKYGKVVYFAGSNGKIAKLAFK